MSKGKERIEVKAPSGWHTERVNCINEGYWLTSKLHSKAKVSQPSLSTAQEETIRKQWWSLGITEINVIEEETRRRGNVWSLNDERGIHARSGKNDQAHLSCHMHTQACTDVHTHKRMYVCIQDTQTAASIEGQAHWPTAKSFSNEPIFLNHTNGKGGRT